MESKQATAVRPAQGAPAEVDVEEAEAALVESYPHVVRLAYLTLPASLGRHRRVLTAHTLVQGALPRARRAAGEGAADVPGPRGTTDPAYALVRQEVLRGALRFEGRAGWRRYAGPAVAWARPPYVWGLRLHPKAGGTDESALDRTLAGLDAAGRAAYVLRELEDLDGREVRGLLAALGVRDARAAVRAAEGVAEGLLDGGEFDPCTVQARPTDLLRRRQHVKAGLIVAGAVAITGVLVGMLGGAPAPYAAGGSPSGTYGGSYRDPGKLVRAKAAAWKDTGRVDFTAWPARGGRTKDEALLRRALAVWASPGKRVQVSATQGTSKGVPSQEPQLLYAGDVDQAAVVVMYDGMRIVRYAEPHGGDGAAALDFARVDGADVTTAAVVVGRADGNTRFLTAPWVSEARTRDLLGPGRASQGLHRSADGVTDPVRMPGADSTDGACGSSWPVLQLKAAARLGDSRPFLLTDLGDLVPVHLTYQASGSAGPTEATGRNALASWARTACHLGSLAGQGVRSVNNWEYADQQLPESNGTAAWVCTRSDTWRGGGRALALFLPPASSATSPAAPVGQSSSDTGACSGYVPHVLAGVLWKSTAGHWYLLAAGSPDVARIRATDGVSGTATGSTMAVPAKQGARAELTGVLDSGDPLTTLR
ncbi:hypothetical protein ACFXJ5_16795 [Streptomyces sp. NPDC059373]